MSCIALCNSSHDINILGCSSVFSACFIAFLTLFLAEPNSNTSHGCNQAVVLDGIGTTVMLFLLHSSLVMYDLLLFDDDLINKIE